MDLLKIAARVSILLDGFSPDKHTHRGVRSAWPMNKGEVGGDVERYFDITEVTRNGKLRFKLKLVSGPPVDDPSLLDVGEDDASDARYGRFFDYIGNLTHPGYPEDLVNTD
jgi:hypothetical protein